MTGTPETITDDKFVGWASPGQKFYSAHGRHNERTSVFYSHQFGNNHAESYLRYVSERFAAFADVSTGHVGASGDVTAAIRSRIKASSLVIVQLDPFRSSIGLEIGWACGFGKEVLLAVQDASVIRQYPNWIRKWEFQVNGQKHFVNFSELARQRLIANENTSDAGWVRDEDDRLLAELPRDVGAAFVLGSGRQLEDTWSRFADICIDAGLPEPNFLDTSDLDRGGLFDEVVIKSRTATTLVAVMSENRNANLLAHVGIGAHTFEDADRQVEITGTHSRILVRRNAYVLDGVEPSVYRSSGLLAGMRHSLVSPRVERIVGEAFGSFQDVLRRADAARQKGKSGKGGRSR